MNDEIRFLKDAAAELQRLAFLAPEISDHLRELAVDLERQIGRIEGERRRGCAP